MASAASVMRCCCSTVAPSSVTFRIVLVLHHPPGVAAHFEAVAVDHGAAALGHLGHRALCVEGDAVEVAGGQVHDQQITALFALQDSSGISAAALARRCGVTPPTMNSVLANLKDLGLIERTPHAWHRNILETRLTEAGEKTLRDADKRAVRVERALADEFTAAERKTLTELLERATARLEATRPE